MFDNVINYFLTEPRRLENLGSTFASIGAAVILAGLLGHAAVVATGAVGSLAGQPNLVKTLAEMYPSLPTWWIPETLVGGLPAIFLAVAGLWFNAIGRQIRQAMY